MKYFFSLLTIFFNFIFSQCDGCNPSFQAIDLWNIQINCEKKVQNYMDCNSTNFFTYLTQKQSDINFNEFGSQKWNYGKLEYFYFYDNRYFIDENGLKELENVNSLFLDGVPIQLNVESIPLNFEGEHILFRQNGFKTLLTDTQFSENLKYISLDENLFYGELPQYFFNYPNLINLSIEYNNLNGEIPEDVSGAIKLKNFTLNNNKLSGKVPDSICELQDLKVLHLQYNELSELPDCICELKKRGVQIELYGNKFCNEIPKCIENDIGFQECF